MDRLFKRFMNKSREAHVGLLKRLSLALLLLAPPAFADEGGEGGAPESAPRGARSYLSLGLEYSSASATSGDTIQGRLPAHLYVGGAQTFFVEGGFMKEKDLGVNAALSYDTERKYNSDQLALFVLSLNATYRTGRYHYFLGPNYSYVDWAPTLSEPSYSFEVKGDIGYQFGFEFQINDRLYFWNSWRKINAKINLQSSGAEIRGQQNLEGIQVGLRYEL